MLLLRGKLCMGGGELATPFPCDDLPERKEKLNRFCTTRCKYPLCMYIGSIYNFCRNVKGDGPSGRERCIILLSSRFAGGGFLFVRYYTFDVSVRVVRYRGVLGMGNRGVDGVGL